MVRLTSLPAFAVVATAAMAAQAADYGQYMDQYADSGHSSPQAGGYQHMMGKYAGDYTGHAGAASMLVKIDDREGSDHSKFTKGGRDKNVGKGGGQDGGYQQYMDQYGNYSKYTGPSGGTSGSSPGGSYSQYMPSGGKTGAGGQGGQGRDYMSQYASGFMGGGAGPKASASATSLVSMKGDGPQASAGGFQQYLTNYASDYTGGAGPNAGFQQFMGKYAADYGGQYTGSSQQGGPAAQSLLATRKSSAVGLKVKAQGANSSEASGEGAGYQKYMKEYAGSYAGGGQGKQGGWEHYMSDYASQYTGGGANATSLAAVPGDASGNAGGYQQYVSKYAGGGNQTMAQNQQVMNALPYAAADCKTMAQLKAWRASKTQQMTRFVPKAYQAQPLKDVEKEYHAAKAQLQAKAAQSAKDSEKEAEPAEKSSRSAGVQDKATEKVKPTKAVKDSAAAGDTAKGEDIDTEDADAKDADAKDADAKDADAEYADTKGGATQLAEIRTGATSRHVSLTVIGLAAVAISWVGLKAFRRLREFGSEDDDSGYTPMYLDA